MDEASSIYTAQQVSVYRPGQAASQTNPGAIVLSKGNGFAAQGRSGKLYIHCMTLGRALASLLTQVAQVPP